MNKSIDESLAFRRAVRKYKDEPIPEGIVKKCVERSVLAPSSSNMQLWEFHHIQDEEMKKKLSHFCLDQNAASTAPEMLVVVVRKDLWRKRAASNIDFLKNTYGNKKEEDYTNREKMAMNYYKKVMPIVYLDFLGLIGYIKYAVTSIVSLFRPMYRDTKNSDSRIIAHKSAALAAQTFMLSMASEGLDTCPMEGLDSTRVRRLLKLPYGAEINMVISCGYRADDGVYGPRFRLPIDEVYKKW